MSQDSAPRYPLVLVPGMLGFVRLLLYPYWHGIISALRQGGAVVIAVQVSPLHSSEVRGEQLLARIDEILRETGAEKVNLIGHSQGSLTARYAAAKRPDRVASVTSVAGPNHGSELADYLHEHYPHDSVRGRMLSSLLRWVAALMSLLDYGALVRDDGWRILLVIGVSTLLVMVVTAFTVEAVCRWRLRHEV